MLPVIGKGHQWIAIQKPAGMTVEKGSQAYDTVESLLRAHWPSRAFVGFPHRLDRPTSGILLVARNKSTLRALNQQFAAGQVQKHYLMLTQKTDLPQAQTLTHWLQKDRKQRRASITDQSTLGAKEARLWFRHLQVTPQQHTLLQVRLFTGRYHQIRAQMAHVGAPVLNDTPYGSEKLSPEPCIALHAWRIQFADPKTGKTIYLEAPLPQNPCWPASWQGKRLEEIS